MNKGIWSPLCEGPGKRYRLSFLRDHGRTLSRVLPKCRPWCSSNPELKFMVLSMLHPRKCSLFFWFGFCYLNNYVTQLKRRESPTFRCMAALQSCPFLHSLSKSVIVKWLRWTSWTKVHSACAVGSFQAVFVITCSPRAPAPPTLSLPLCCRRHDLMTFPRNGLSLACDSDCP